MNSRMRLTKVPSTDGALTSLQPCSHQPPCPGCPNYGRPLLASHSYQTLAEFAARQGVPLELRTGPPLAYRHRARLAVRGRTRSPKLGVFQLGSHRIVDIPNCQVHHPLINRVARALKGALKACGVPPYREANPGGRPGGRVRYLQVCVARAAGTAQVTVVDNNDSPAGLESTLQALQQELGDALHSLFWNGQQSEGNAILGSDFQRLWGPPALVEHLGGAEVFFPPGAFAQANMPLFADVVARIHGFVPADARVLEFYGGVGAIGLGLVERSQEVACNELAPGSLEGLRMGRDSLLEPQRGKLRLLEGPAEAFIGEVAGADVVIVDPPRRGLDEPLLDGLCQQRPGRLIYLSCGLPTFLRDAGALLASGYRLSMLEAIDLFPNTGHLETLAVFDAP